MTDLTLQLLFLLLPGVVAALLVEKLATGASWSQFRFALYSLLLGTASYALLEVAVRAVRGFRSGFAAELEVWHALLAPNMSTPASEVLLATGMAAGLGLLIALSVRKRWLYRFATAVRVSDKYGDEGLFAKFLAAEETQWVVISDEDVGLSYEGRVTYLSEVDHLREVVLADVRVYNYEDATHLYDLKSMYASFAPGRLVIERRIEKEEVPDG